ncbi:P-loop containing nucleoside triphosphate hydrolase protein [Dendryphion nanum]|uniref:RNA helicase n=1 Tax=Dendryphion nanum TaxID=256645 RepID=A0A9P9DI10_9PLEO|nr:P-loop containing nucleoside triphosphate hydrolase protein [Dendryphion nanum]
MDLVGSQRQQDLIWFQASTSSYRLQLPSFGLPCVQQLDRSTLLATTMAPPGGKERSGDVNDLRLRSRQSYLAKREEQQLVLLRQQVEAETEELRTNSRLSEAEKQEFATNRKTLQLAQERLLIDDHKDGFFIPDAEFTSKSEILNKTSKETYKSEVQQWEDEQTTKARAAQVQSSKRKREEDYEFVFDTSQAPKWDIQTAARLDAEKERLSKMLDAAEEKAKSIDQVRKSLPIYAYKDELLQAVKDHQVLIVCAETGSGKTTQIPQYLAEVYGKEGMVACTQPRRVAAMSVAKRVSEEMGCRLSAEVGYVVRFDSKVSDKTIVKYMTDGLLLKECFNSPGLDGYKCIVLDEAHERTLATDILFGLLKDLIRLRSDLRIIIASATLNAQAFSEYWNAAPVLMVPGRTHPVDVYFSSSPEADYLKAALTTVFQIHCTMPLPGDILVFLSGQEEIESLAQNIEETARKLAGRCPEIRVAPIYAALPSDLQALIFEPTPKNCRKVILATNIAETSLTVDGVVYVVDPGFQKLDMYNPRSGISSLSITPISKASSGQRAGRAGRTGPGKCFRLYTRYSYTHELPADTTPEIQRTNLDSVVLTLKGLGINDLVGFDFMSPPSADALMKSLENLYALGALNESGQLSKMGRSIAEFPLNPFLAKTIIGGEKYNCVEEILSIVALLPESGSLFFRPKEKKLESDAARERFTSREAGDMGTLLNIWNQWVDADYDAGWAKQNYLQIRTLNRARDVRDQLEQLATRVGLEITSSGSSDHIAVRKALTSGLFINAARLQRDGLSYRLVKNGLTTYIHPSSVMMENRSKWIIYYELQLTTKEYMRSVMPIEPEWLTEAAPHFHKSEELDKLGVDKKVGKHGQGKVGV